MQSIPSEVPVLYPAVRINEGKSQGVGYPVESILKSNLSYIPRLELVAGDMIQRDLKKLHEIRYTEMGTDSRRYITQRWELMAGDTIYKDWN